jgi:hypothetical protein
VLADAFCGAAIVLSLAGDSRYNRAAQIVNEPYVFV